MNKIIKIIFLASIIFITATTAYADAYINPNVGVSSNTTLFEEDKITTTTISEENKGDTGTVVDSNREETTPNKEFQSIPEEKPTVVENLDSSNNNYPIGSNISNERKPADERQFIMFQTKEGDEFYLIIDHSKTSNNVILLNQVTNQDLMALTSNNGYYSSSITPPQGYLTGEIEKDDTKAEEETEEVQKEEKKRHPILSFLILFAVIFAFAIAIYKFRQISKQNKADENEISTFNSEDEDDYEYDEIAVIDDANEEKSEYEKEFTDDI